MSPRSALSTVRQLVSGTRSAATTAPTGKPASFGPRNLCVVKPAADPGRLPPVDPRHLSPKQTADLSTELYVSGNITYHEHLLLGFPAELHPDYDRTIGILTGRTAEPDRPQDVLAGWEQRLAFENRYGSTTPIVADRVARIVGVLRSLAAAAGDETLVRTGRDERAPAAAAVRFPIAMHSGSGGRPRRAVA